MLETSVMCQVLRVDAVIPVIRVPALATDVISAILTITMDISFIFIVLYSILSLDMRWRAKGNPRPLLQYELERIRPFGATLIRSKTIALVSLDGGREDEEDLFFRIGAVRGD